MTQCARLLLFGLLLAVLSACGMSAPATGSTTPLASSGTTTSGARTSSLVEAGATPSPSVNTLAEGTGGTTELNVFAAASLTNAFTAIGEQFEATNPTTTVTFNFAGSQQLAQQIGQGAPADVFASANRAQMDKVIEAGQVIPGTDRTFVRNRLVVIYPHNNPARLSSLQDLAKPGLKLVLAAQEVPVGQYALDVLARASELPQYTTAYREAVLANVVSYEENVRAVLSKVALGEADAGIVYTSDISGDTAEQVGRIDIPDELNTIATYPIAPIKDAPNAVLARKFVDYVLSPEAQQILAQYGFLAVTP